MLRDEVAELNRSTKALVDAWNAANSLVRFIKVLATIARLQRDLLLRPARLHHAEGRLMGKAAQAATWSGRRTRTPALGGAARPENAQGQGQPDRLYRVHHADVKDPETLGRAATARSISTRRSQPRSRKLRRATSFG
jgi:hypothetical protein